MPYLEFAEYERQMEKLEEQESLRLITLWHNPKHYLEQLQTKRAAKMPRGADVTPWLANPLLARNITVISNESPAPNADDA